MRRFDVEQDGALAGALLVGALLVGATAVGLEACPLVALAAALAGATLDCEADG